MMQITLGSINNFSLSYCRMLVDDVDIKKNCAINKLLTEILGSLR